MQVRRAPGPGALIQTLMEVPRPEHFIVLDTDPGERAQTVSALLAWFPHARISEASSRSDLDTALTDEPLTVVVIDTDITFEHPVALMRELKQRDEEPLLLLTSRSSDPDLLSLAYNAGCQRCLIKRGSWQEELAPAVRQLLRVRKLEEDNVRLLTRVLESNMLLEEKNRRLDEFCATLAHDIRSPLGGVSMKLDYLIDTISPQLEPRVQLMLTRASQSVERLTAIVQSMYEYAKLGEKAAKMQEVALGTLADEVVGDMKFDDALDITIGIGDLPQVWGNPELLRRVLINLLANAVKYNDKEKIVINLGCEATWTRGLGEYCDIYVQDNGPGIPSADQERIFSMFARGTNPTQQEGMGIGLAVVSRIVDLHYGQLRVVSEPGSGAKFVLSLPTKRLEMTR